MPGFKFTENQKSDLTGGFTPVTSFDPNRVLVTNQYGYAESSDILVSDLEDLTGLTKQTFDNIASLRAYTNISIIPSINPATVLGYYTKYDGGGSNFVWDGSSIDADNGISVIQPTGVSVGRWKRVWDGGPINCRVAGCKGDGVTDDSARFQALIDAYAVLTVPAFAGVTIEIGAGKYILGDISIPSGVRIYSPQTAKYIYIPTLACEVYPKAGATYVFHFLPGCANSELEGIYIDGDFSNNPNLQAAVRFTGNGCNLRYCLFNRCAQAAVISDAGNSFIEHNGIFGWYGPAPTFTGMQDFRGALHILAMGDAYIKDNEIGAGLPYFGTYPDPMDVLRDKVNRRICSVAAIGFVGTSVISGNLFENGDSGFVFCGPCLYNTMHHNRYELCGGGGLRMVPGASVSYVSFIGERFSDNSLAGDGVFDDVEMAPGTAGFLVFDSPIFERIANGAIPPSIYKSRWHFNNKASTEFDIITPQVDATYTGSGLINNTDIDAFPMRQVKGQYFPDEPVYQKVTVTGPITSPQKGYIVTSPGTDSGSGSFPGALEFYDAANRLIMQQGFSPVDVNGYFSFKMVTPLFWLFSGAKTLFATAGENQLQIQSTDAAGDTVIRMISDFIGTKITEIRQNKTSGDLTITCGGDIVLGVASNMKFLNSGQNIITNAPPDSSSGYHILSRNDSTGGIEKVPANAIFALHLGQPTATLGANVTGSIVSPVPGTDTRGTVIINATGGTVAAGDILATVTFSAAYSSTPGVVIGDASILAHTVGAYLDNNSTTGFNIKAGIAGTLSAGAYSFGYIVIQ